MAKGKRKKFYFLLNVERAVGWQVFSVVAATAGEAMKKLKVTGGQFEEEEVTVEKLGEPELVGEEEVG